MTTPTALLVVDLQRDFLEPSGRMPVDRKDAENVIAVANRMLQHAEALGWARIIIQSEFDPKDWFGNMLRRHAAIAGTAGSEIDPRLVLRPGFTLFTKARGDALSNHGLTEFLEQAGIRSVVVLGVMAEGCVRATVRHAVRAGFRVTVPTDGVASTRGWLRKVGTWEIRRIGVTCLSSQELLSRES